MKQTWQAALRNAEPITEELRRLLKAPLRVLEIASGTGQHAAYFCEAMPEVTWYPTEYDPTTLSSIGAWQQESGLSNLKAPTQLDVCDEVWPLTSVDAVFCANMIHIAPWECCQGLMRGCARLLPSGGSLVLYGPFFMADVETAPSNLAFDESLRSRHPEWGVRDLAQVEAEARANELALVERTAMPANNFILHFRRR